MRTERFWFVCSLAVTCVAAAVLAAPPATVVDADADGIPDNLAEPMVGPPSMVLAEDSLAVQWAGNVYKLDSSTGAGSLLGASGTQSLNAETRAADGTIYAAGRGNVLWKIDENTGQAIAGPNINLADIRGIAMSPGNVLYAVNDVGFGLPDNLHTIDVNNGNTAMIGGTGVPGIQGLEFGSNGNLYAWDLGTGQNGMGLVRINVNTGQATDVNPNIGGGGHQFLMSGPGGALWTGRDALYTVDINTGQENLVGSGGYNDLRGCNLLAGGKRCEYTLSKSKAKGGCPNCPRKGATIQTQESCEDVGDCRKKLKTTINCPEGQGTCKLKGKATGCR